MAAFPHRHTRTLIVALALAFALWGVLMRTRPAGEAFPYGVLRIGIDPSTPPLAFIADDQLRGLEIDLGTALGERLGLPVQFVSIGFDGLYDALRADQVDAVISQLIVNPLRTGDVLYSRPYYDAGLVLVIPPGSDIRSMRDLPGHRLAVEFGSAADAEARLWLRRLHPFEQAPYEFPNAAVNAVQRGLADAALLDFTTARQYLREFPTWPAHTLTVTHVPYAIAVSRQRPLTWREIERALASLIADKTLETLINRWL